MLISNALSADESKFTILLRLRRAGSRITHVRTAASRACVYATFRWGLCVCGHVTTRSVRRCVRYECARGMRLATLLFLFYVQRVNLARKLPTRIDKGKAMIHDMIFE
ncbi:hypothetical protein PUN28_016231 [Cardiocondyla obscurior]|uniref:Uncharacterized protein n=1 Tax=Cardiocondyla obscurior TaxID=286306 RepID=A0AAW2EU21_9HYME